MSPEEATLAASVINAKHDMPIHTMPPPDSYSNAIVARFTSPNKLVVKPGSTIALNAITSVGQIKTLPAAIKLNQNYPNPFNPSTIISYSIPSTEFVVLKIFNALGHEVKTLVNKQQKAGDYQVRFDGKNLSSGVYFCRLITGNYNITRKIVLQK